MSSLDIKSSSSSSTGNDAAAVYADDDAAAIDTIDVILVAIAWIPATIAAIAAAFADSVAIPVALDDAAIVDITSVPVAVDDAAIVDITSVPVVVDDTAIGDALLFDSEFATESNNNASLFADAAAIIGAVFVDTTTYNVTVVITAIINGFFASI